MHSKVQALSSHGLLSIGQTARKAVNLIIGVANAKWSLRRCTSVGLGARVRGRMRLQNHGSVVIGERFSVASRWVPTEILSGKGARIEIGDAVWINFGVVIASIERVTIGDRVMIGQHCIVSDTDFPDMARAGISQPARAIEIGDDVWLAGRVTVRPGVRIGNGSIIISGSIVERDIPAYVVAGGIPARPLRKLPKPQGRVAATLPGSQLRGYLISDFRIDDLAGELSAADLFAGLGAAIAPMGDLREMLSTQPPPGATDFAVIWTRPTAAIAAFSKLATFEVVDDAVLLAEVDEFCELIKAAAPRFGAVFVPTWIQPSWERGLGIVDTRRGGTSLGLATMNLRLMDRLSNTPNVFVMNASRWLDAVGPAGISARAWYLGNVAVTRAVMAEAARDVRAALGALHAGPRSLLLLDLDDTLWGGLVRLGWQGLALGGDEGTGRAYADFQKSIKDLKRRGVALGIISKNEESVALEAIRSHPAMILRETDFAGWRINRNDMAANIRDLARELQVDLGSVVFIDDSPSERARIRASLPDVYVPDWPKDVLLYPSALRALRCFDSVGQIHPQ